MTICPGSVPELLSSQSLKELADKLSEKVDENSYVFAFSGKRLAVTRYPFPYIFVPDSDFRYPLFYASDTHHDGEEASDGYLGDVVEELDMATFVTLNKQQGTLEFEEDEFPGFDEYEDDDEEDNDFDD